MTGSKIGSLEFNIKKAKKELDEIGAEKLLIQLPEGLKPRVIDFAELFDQEVTIWGGTCYGACDLPKNIGDHDALLHVGHSEIPNLDADYPIVYLPGKSTIFRSPPDRLFEKLDKKVALYAPIQHVHQLNILEKILSEKSLKPIHGSGDQRVKHPGQVLGCNYSVKVEDADHHLYLGTGKFHPLGLSLSLNENILTYNPYTQEIDEINEKDRDKFKRKRFASISKAEECSKIGIIISNKKGQSRYELAKELLRNSKDKNLKSVLIELDEIKKKSMTNFQLDCIVNTACPRITLDDSDKFDPIILSPDEFRVVLKIKDWETLSVIDEIY